MEQEIFEFGIEDLVDEVDDRALPEKVFNQLNARFDFTYDVAASHENHQLPKYCTKEEDGLLQSWAGERVYCNPPYSNIEPWVKKAWKEHKAEIIVMLLPANRTEQKWWQEWVEPFRDKPGGLTCEFLPGRIRFLRKGAKIIGPNERPPFGCCLLIFQR